MDESAKIVAFVRDLNLSVRIESGADRVGFQVQLFEGAEQVSRYEAHELAQGISGGWQIRGGSLLNVITSLGPALMVFDLGNDEIPWQNWITLLSSDPSTRRIPIICFGPHVDSVRLKAAKDAGAEVVVARSRFFNSLPELITKHAKIQTKDQLAGKCQGSLSELAVKGIEEFNRGEYFEAHELLENAWMEDESTGRDVYRAMLQVAVAYYQVMRGNYPGALKLFLRIRQWLDPLPEMCKGVDIARLKKDVNAVQREFLELGPDKVDEFNVNLLHPIEYRN